MFATPAVSKGVVYIGSRDGSFQAIDSVTGVAAWTIDLSEVLSSAAIAGDQIYVGSSDGNLYVLNRADGSEVAALPVGELVWTPPAVVNGHLFFGTHDNNLHGYALN